MAEMNHTFIANFFLLIVYDGWSSVKYLLLRMLLETVVTFLVTFFTFDTLLTIFEESLTGLGMF